jgi:hypothetical protein
VWAGSSDGTQQCGGTYELQANETPQQLGARAGQALIAQGALKLIIT